MCEYRKLAYRKHDLILFFTNIIAIISKYEKGFIEYIFDKDNLVGAFIVVYQGNSARYFKSAIDPERRDISIMHFGLFEAMKYCKEQGYLKFDLWGYNHFVDEKDQLYRVNLFKKGFAGDFTFFPKRMNFEFKPFSYKIFLFLKFIKDGIFNFWIKKY
jgi:lipid II:glycine glycyltransferase (peptidoglycan interpeptide bridge formation enzyme)